ncbi:MAG TPA: class I SAM-dependent rRNA methyltransferase [Solibacterales bacterium]|nr:class I SAM-dependent rRNA methyltransferase [Bryobacterales bacterium]
MTAVQVNRKGAGRIAAGHPWIFKTDILHTGGAGRGDVVRVTDQAGRTLGTGHYSSASQIALRMLSARVENVDRAFFRERIAAAARHRQRMVQDATAYRLVFAEADLLPALIIDCYGQYLVVQALDQGMDRALPEIVAALLDVFEPAGILARNDAGVRSLEELPREVRVLHGEIPKTVAIQMNGLTMFADLTHGQKTGVFLDQRENYVAAAQYAGGRALDCFTSTGGFALHMAARCESVEAIDSSETALRTARRNADENGIGNVDFREADSFAVLAGHASARRMFDTVVLDPPAFAKTRGQMEGALRGYREINQRALRILKPGGMLITCSCSQHLGEADFLELLAEAALDARRTVRVIERRMQSRDHPVLLTVPETMYLKCLIVECW